MYGANWHRHTIQPYRKTQNRINEKECVHTKLAMYCSKIHALSNLQYILESETVITVL